MKGTLTLVLMMSTGLQGVYCRDSFSCIGTCYSGRLAPESQDIFHGWHLKGYSYKNTTTDNPIKCYSSCVQDCRCKACQMQDKRCELLEEDKSSKSSDFVAASRYVYYDIKQTLYHGAYHMLPPGKCHNGCCRSQPCMNGGTCTEHCHDPKNKFTCKCSSYFTGKVCEKYTSCVSVLKAMPNGKTPRDGVYHNFFNNDTGASLSLYCAFRPNSVWTLIESFSRANNLKLCYKPFYSDAPFNRTTPNWDLYRLSLEEMTYLRTKANIFIATCNYPLNVNSPLEKDYLFGSYRDDTYFDIMSPRGSWLTCQKYAEINIRGNPCMECHASTFQTSSMHVQLDPRQNSKCSYVPEVMINGNYFACYQHDQTDTLFSCSSADSSTTQWWFGEPK